MKLLWIIVQVLIGYHLVFPLVLYALSRLRKESFLKLSNQNYDYGIIVTAFQETSMLPQVIGSLLELNYKNYLIYLVADDCDVSGLNFDSERVILLRPPAQLASNVKSHFYAINHFRRSHEVVTIIDSDNLVDPEYLNRLNAYFNKGFKAVQGYRKPKKLTTALARLDAIRDLYYHFYDGEVLFKAGSSATLAGSGMAFKTTLYTASLRGKEVSGAGFDKFLQAQIVRRNKRIAFAPDAVVYDEKTKFSNQLVKQRARWINTWFKYAGNGRKLLANGLKYKRLNSFLFGIVLLRPPLFIFLTLSFICLLVNVFTSLPGTVLWSIAWILFLYGFFIPIRREENRSEFYSALWTVPKFMLMQFIALLFARGANRRSVATRHQQVNL